MSSQYHDEVAEALRAIGNPRHGEAVRADRGSQLQYFGASFPAVRARTKAGFSFYQLPQDEILAVWDELWRHSSYGEVLFAAIEYYRKQPKRQPSSLWGVARGWVDRVDNWAHADMLAGLHSELLERSRDEVYPQLRQWNASDQLWERRVSLVSLIHYSGKNAVFMPLDAVLPLVSNCLDDDRHYVQTAVGWVLRETGNTYPGEVLAYLEANISRFSAAALSRAIERRPGEERARLRALKRASGG